MPPASSLGNRRKRLDHLKLLDSLVRRRSIHQLSAQMVPRAKLLRIEKHNVIDHYTLRLFSTDSLYPPNGSN